MHTGGRGYRQAGQREPTPVGDRSETVVNVQGEPVYEDTIRVGEPAIALADLLRDDVGQPHGLRGWRLA